MPSHVTEDLVALGRTIVEANDYLTLATADADGVPWASPVWFAHEACAAFVWVSRPQARHSLNIAVRPEVGFAIFDSTVTPGTGRGTYCDGLARQVGDTEVDRWLAVYNARAERRTERSWTVDDVMKPDGLRLYVATTTQQWVLDDRDRRVAVHL